MIGAIIGDVIGSAYEFNNVRNKNFKAFTSKTTFTDDTVCTIALMDYFLHAEKYDEENAVKYLHAWTNRYPNAGYGGRFRQWVLSKNPKPYNSFGNGSAMRISSVGWVANNLTELGELSNTVTKITHNHPEGLKGALVIATCVYMARYGCSKKEIKEYAVSQYPDLNILDYEFLRENYKFVEICQGSVPEAIYCFLISEDFDDCLRTTISIGGDCDTTAAMSCAIAEAYYRYIPDYLIEGVRERLTPEMLEIVDEFAKKYGGHKMKQRDVDYNEALKEYEGDHRSLNGFVMSHTMKVCTEDPTLKMLTESTIVGQKVIYEKDELNVKKDGPTTNIIVSNKRSFEAAIPYFYAGKSVAVLNFANNHSVGGAPYSAGAQEESLCRMSNLYPCLLSAKESFYDYHMNLYEKHLMDEMGNSDIIYTRGVTVFKTDESAPKMLEKKEWYLVDVITCAAPVLYYRTSLDYKKYRESTILPRLRRVFEVAKQEQVDVLILGAWGCGAFHNPPEIIAEVFKTLCQEYHFDTVEFAIDASRKPNNNYDVFKEVFEK